MAHHILGGAMHSDTITLEYLRSKPAICHLLKQYFDVEIGPHCEEDWYHFREEQGYDSFGAEGAGGRYIQLRSGKIVFIDSEGSAGVIAETLPDFLDLAINAAYWPDVLQFAPDGDLMHMRQAEQERKGFEENEEDWPEPIRQSLNQALHITPRAAYADQLHQVITRHWMQPAVLAPDGAPYDGLMRDFKPPNY